MKRGPHPEPVMKPVLTHPGPCEVRRQVRMKHQLVSAQVDGSLVVRPPPLPLPLALGCPAEGFRSGDDEPHAAHG